MRCVEFQQRWQLLLDQRRSPEDDKILRAHADGCPDCDEFLQLQTILFREVARTRSTNIPSGARSRQRWANTMLIALSVACSLLVVVVPAWRHMQRRYDGDRLNRSVVLTGQRGGISPGLWVAKTPSLAQPRVSETSPRIAPLNAVALTAEQESLRKLMQDMAARLSDVPEEKLEPLDRIAGGFRPLANTLGVAWDALRRTIPVGRGQIMHEPQAVLGWNGLQASA